MKWMRLVVPCLLPLLLVSGEGAWSAQTIKGTVVSASGSAGFLRLEIDGVTVAIAPGPDAKIFRGQIGQDPKPASLSDFAAGDHVVAVVDQNDRASSVKGFYGRVQGVFKKANSGRLIFDDGRSVPLSKQPQIVLPDGEFGVPSDIKPGSVLVCRVNPLTNEAWTVVSTSRVVPSAGTSQTPPSTAAAKKSPPKIASIAYSAPSPLKPGDLLTVDMAGTPGGTASFDVKGLLPATPMNEISAGAYRAVVKVPGGKPVFSVPLVGHLALGDKKASAVQASRLVTVAAAAKMPAATLPKQKAGSVTLPASAQPNSAATDTKPKVLPPAAQMPDAAFVQPVTLPAIDSARSPVLVPPAVETSARKPTTDAASNIVITDPPDGARIQRMIMVKGKAEPDSSILISITYNNGLTGLLRLSGQVAFQRVAVGKNGEFRMGPMALEGPLATQGLRFTIKAYYPDRDDHSTARTVVIGDRH